MRELLNDIQWRPVKKFFTTKKGIIWHKMGEGKTRIALALNYYLKIKNITVVVCRKKAFHSWRDELLKVGWGGYVAEFPKTTWYSKKRNTIWLVSHAMLHKVYTLFEQYPIDLIIFDELYLYSNPKALISQAARACGIDNRIGLSGTIMPAKDNTAIFSQANTIGISHLLAPNLTAFRSKFQSYFQADYGHGSIRRFVNKKGSDEKILGCLHKHIDLHFPSSSDRKIHDSFIDVDPTKQQLKLIHQLKEEYYVEHGDQEFEIKSTLELIHKVSGISNGYLGKTNIYSSKLDALDSKVRECLNETDKVLLWCYYQRDVVRLSECFKDCRCTTMSGTKKLDRNALRKAQIVIATVGTGSSLNDFGQIAYAFYFSNSAKLLDYEQSRGRTDRTDSKHSNCYYTYFFTRKTFDRHIFQLAKTSGKIQANFINLI